jgi:putative transposase
MKKSSINTSHHAVFRLHVHLVLVTKYRHRVLREEIRAALEGWVRALARKWRIEVVEFGGEEDHVHLLLSLRPDIQPSVLVNNIKSVSSRRLRKEYGKEFSMKGLSDVVWSRSYCLISCGGASLETLKEYIEAQGADEAT